jgi:hypothetical protein
MGSLQKIALFAGFAVAVYAVFSGNLLKTYRATAKLPPAAGWEQLDACSPMQSLDGTKELTFLEDHTVKVVEQEAKTQSALRPSRTAGAWAYDQSTQRYFITLEQQQKSYTLVQPENSEVCILIYGELTAANMRESWFSTVDIQSDIEPPDRF